MHVRSLFVRRSSHNAFYFFDLCTRLFTRRFSAEYSSWNRNPRTNVFAYQSNESLAKRNSNSKRVKKSRTNSRYYDDDHASKNLEDDASEPMQLGSTLYKIPGEFRAAQYKRESSFSKLGVSITTESRLEAAGLKTPTSIQNIVIPFLLQTHSHALIAAPAGSGKIVAFLVPLLQMLDRIVHISTASSPKLLILVPNILVAQQVEIEAKRLVKSPSRVFSCPNEAAQRELIRTKGSRHFDVFITTSQLMQRLAHFDDISTRHVRYVVNYGFDAIVDQLDYVSKTFQAIDEISLFSTVSRSVLQVIFVTSTISDAMMNILKQNYLNKLQIVVDPTTHYLREDVKHSFYFTESVSREYLLLELLGVDETQQLKRASHPTIVFFSSPRSIRHVEQLLQKNGYGYSVVHMLNSPEVRLSNWQDFIDDKYNILITTEGIPAYLNKPVRVINYSFAVSLLMYLRRAERVGSDGQLATMCNSVDKPFVDMIQEAIAKKLPLDHFQAKSNPAIATEN